MLMKFLPNTDQRYTPKTALFFEIKYSFAI